jgi:hypothetical protein
MGGFDEKYARPSIEDIELGVRLRQAGHRVWLCPEVQVAHLKRWNLSSLLRSDILDRAVPWTQLILTRSGMPTDLNLDLKSRLSALATWAMLFCLALGFALPWTWVGVVVFVAALLVLNADLYRFFALRGGLRFAIGACGLHALYFLYSSLIFGMLLAWHWVQKLGVVFRSSNLTETSSPARMEE